MPVIQAETVRVVGPVEIPEPLHPVTLLIEVEARMEVGPEVFEPGETIACLADNKDAAGDPQVDARAQVRAESLFSLQGDIPEPGPILSDPAQKGDTHGVVKGPP